MASPESTASVPRLYGELAEWWPLLSPPSDYEQEAGSYLRELTGALGRPPASCVEFGSGGGSNASYLKRAFPMTLVDLSEGMLAHSRRLNPECEHVQGDMRTVQLGRTFEAVFVHDAICYMTTEDDLGAAIATAYRHCAAGGVALFCPDFVKETFQAVTSHGGTDASDGRGMRYLEWCWDPDPSDTGYTVDYAYLLRAANGSVRVEHDRHVEGLFPRQTWLELLGQVGFEARAQPLDLGEPEHVAYQVFACRKRA